MRITMVHRVQQFIWKLSMIDVKKGVISLNKKWWIFFFCFITIVFIVGCGETESDATVKVTAGTPADTEADVKTNEEEEATGSETTESLALPEGLPSDFPLPNPMTITKVNDQSDDSKYSYEIRFTFDPNMDMDQTFAMYDDYAKGLGYNIIIGGEEYFADGVFQFGATSKFSTSDMFIITLKPDGNTFGDITFKSTK